MHKIVFDIETKNTFRDAGSSDPARLDLALVGVYDSVADTYTSYTEEELPGLWPLLESTDMLIGYNSDHFDIPLLNKYYPGDLSRIKSVDLMREVKHSIGKRLRLNAIADATLGALKNGSGMDAIHWWREGEIDKVREYCLNDVRITKELYDYALRHRALKYRDLNEVRDIPLDTSSWEAREDASMTHTLPF